nr:hypothetical protein [Tanacetum cinerariifolium]
MSLPIIVKNTWTMATTIEQQVALDEALVHSTQRLRIGRSNFRLPSHIQSKESTLQVIYDVLRRCPFFKAFLVTADVPEIYMQELWAIAYVHQHSIEFKLDNKKHIVNLETFRDMLHICPRIPGQSFDDYPLKRRFWSFLGEADRRRIFLSLVVSVQMKELALNQEFRMKRLPKLMNKMILRGGDDDEESESDEESDDEETKEEESFDLILRTPEDSEDDGNGDEDQGLRISEEERLNEDEKADELYGDVDINHSSTYTYTYNDSIYHCNHHNSKPSTNSSTPIPSEVLQNLSTFDSVFRFDERLKSLEASFSEYRQTNPFAESVSNISGIVHQYMDQQMNEAVRVAVQIQTDRLRDSYQRENDEFLRTVDDNMKRIIKEQVKGQVKEQVSRILPRIEQSMNAQLEAKVLTRSSHSSRTSYAVAADLSEMELKKIIIKKMESNKSIQRSDEQRNLYKALVEAYEADKIILDTYGETVTLKRRRDDESDKDEGPSAGSDRGSKRRRKGKEPESASASLQTATRSAGRLPLRLKNPHIRCLKQDNPEGQQYPYNLLQPLSLIPENRGRRVIPFAHFINNDLEYLWGGASTQKYTTSVTKTKAVDYGHIKWIKDLFYEFTVNRESALDVYSKRRIIAVTDLKIVEWHSYKHLDWITVRRDDDKLYKFKEGDFKRLRVQDIEDMLLLLVQGKLSNLTVEEHFAFNVSLRMFTRSIVIQ